MYESLVDRPPPARALHSAEMQYSAVKPATPPPNAGADPPSIENTLGFRLGQRVHAAGDPRRTGTVRYVGQLEGYPGAWVGVDWDDGEGKHDGAVNGVRYFEASRERSASFVRPKNLSSGITLLEALELRYRGDSTKEEEDEMYVLSTRNQRVSIQLIGKDKVQEKLNDLNDLVGASILYMGVSSTGPLSEVSTVVPNLRLLDVTGNLFSKWQEIGDICKALPKLEILNLTNNCMEKCLNDLPFLKSIRTLVLNHCGISWKEVELLRESLPVVEELHLMANNINTIIVDDQRSPLNFVRGFDSLKLLNLENNDIEKWDEILKLSRLRSLAQLHLNKNKLKNIFYPDDEFQDKCVRPFENLQSLLLGSNQIEDWSSIDSLNSFPSLEDIRLTENPIVDPEKGGIPRFVLIARLAKVEILNGSEVSSRERKESEIRYVRLVLAKMQSNTLEEIQQIHPRFSELKQLHGIDDEKAPIGAMGPQKMASGLLCITLKCVGASIGEKPPLTRKLPPTTTVGKLKILCESFFKLKNIKLRLFLEELGSPLPVPLDDEMASLVDIGIVSGATVLVDEES